MHKPFDWRDISPFELQRNIRASGCGERKLEGITAAKERGVYKGRPAVIHVWAVRRRRTPGCEQRVGERRGGRALGDRREKGTLGRFAVADAGPPP
jgi:hypothetical protein